MKPEAIRALLADVLGQPMPPLSRDTPFADLPGWDSVVHLSLLLEAERRSGTALTAAQMVSMRTVGDLADALGGRS